MVTYPVGLLSPKTDQEVNVANYQLDGNADDSSGNGYDGILGDGVTPATFPDSVLGGTAYQFNGTTQYISLPNNSITNNLRLRFRIKHDSISRQFYSGYSLAAGFGTFYSVTLFDANTLLFYIGNNIIASVTYSMDLNWHTHEIIYKPFDATTWTTEWWIDDVREYQNTTIIKLSDFTQNGLNKLGRSGDFPSLFFHGIMDYWIISENA